MIFLAAAILFSTLLVITFKTFERLHIHQGLAIAANYCTAALIAYFFHPFPLSVDFIFSFDWTWVAVIIGILFVAVFYITSLTARKSGISATSVANKMSMILPVCFGIFYFKEAAGPLKIAGILLAIAAVVLSVWRKEMTGKSSGRYLLPFILFAGSGTVDLLLNYARGELVPENEHPFFISLLFLFACISGLVYIAASAASGKITQPLRSVAGGIVLGLFNWASLFFLLKSLNAAPMSSSSVFPVISVGIVLLSAITGYLFFKERPGWINYSGIALAIAAIFLISFG